MSEVKDGYVEIHRMDVLMSAAALEVLIERGVEKDICMDTEKTALNRLRAAMAETTN